MLWPTQNLHLNGVVPAWAKFGARAGKHTGLDIGHRYGAPVVAADTGVVRWVGDMQAGGYAVWITHDAGLETRYQHLEPKSILVKKGDAVVAGARIASVGHSGLEYAYPDEKLRVAAHLHFEVLLNGTRMDPEAYLTTESSSALLVGSVLALTWVLLS